MKPIVVFPLGALKADDRKRLIAEGYLPIETDAQVKVIVAEPSLLSAGDIGMCALFAIARAGIHSTAMDFVNLLACKIKNTTGDATPLK